MRCKISKRIEYADQEPEAAEETNEEMEAREMDGFTSGNDNLIIDKNSNPKVIAELKSLVGLLKNSKIKDEVNKLIKWLK
jgi:hypothetical protein